MADPSRADLDPDELLVLEQERASLALDAAGMGEFEWDLEHDLFIVSPRMAAITGLTAGPIPAEWGLKAYSFVYPEDVERVGREVAEGLLESGHYEVRYRMVRPSDGRVIWMYSAATAVLGPSGAVRRVIGRASCRERVCLLV